MQLRHYIVCVLFLLLLAGEAGAAAVRVTALRSWQAPDHTRLVFELSRRAEHKMHVLDNPDRLVLDIAGAGALNEQLVNDVDLALPVTGIRYGLHDNTLRLVVDLHRQVHARSFLLEPNDNYGYRLVVDMYGGEEEHVVAVPPDQKDRDVVVVIDPGHGGEDPGAIGVTGLREKDVVLRFAKILRDEMNRLPGVRVILTREKDYFIGLRKRSALARKQHADLFLSIHANSFPDSQKVRGFMLFALSDKGATSEMARWLAQSENKSDAIGGADSLALTGKSESLRKVLIDLSMTSALNHGIFAGKEILRSVGKRFHLHSSKVEQAAFTVLKSPDVPSLLIELGFLSNRAEEKQLVNGQYLTQMARAIVAGVVQYLRAFPPFGSALAGGDRAAHVYQVVTGDTLSQIAERYRVDVGQLRALNNVSGDTIMVGQKLKIYPDMELAEHTQDFYLVQDGDTLSEIAVRFGVSMLDLRRLNNLHNTNAIRSGQKIWLYAGN